MIESWSKDLLEVRLQELDAEMTSLEDSTIRNTVEYNEVAREIRRRNEPTFLRAEAEREREAINRHYDAEIARSDQTATSDQERDLRAVWLEAERSKELTLVYHNVVTRLQREE